MDRSLSRRAAIEGAVTAGLVLSAFAVGRVAVWLGASAALALVIGTLAVVAAVVGRVLGSGRAVEQPPRDEPATTPNGANTFEVVCSPPATEEVLAVTQRVIDGMVRPTDFVVRHTDGRLLVLVDAAGEGVRESFEARANVRVHVALAEAGLRPVGLTLRPVDMPGPRDD